MMHTDSTLLGDARVRVEEPDAELSVVLDGTTTTTVTTVTIVTTVPRGCKGTREDGPAVLVGHDGTDRAS